MFNIIKADFYKLWKSKILLWITLGFLGILLLGNGLAQGGDGVMTLMSDSMNYNLIHFDKKGTQMRAFKRIKRYTFLFNSYYY